MFPVTRMRRMRSDERIRSMFRETSVDISDFIYPLYIKESTENGNPEEISTMPGQYRYSVDDAVDFAGLLEDDGLTSVILFGIPDYKDEKASSAYDKNGIIQQTIKALKEQTNLVVLGDVCMCEYTDHGHCGIIKDNYVQNDETLKYLSKIAVSYADAGVDVVAPSDMMDGRVGAIREALDKNDYINTPIFSYAAKYASTYYAPFRDAADSTPSFGDRKSYQMDPANFNEAIREVALDVQEGTDAIIVKPALAYLDVLREVKQTFKMPTIAYQVSGEYSMIQAGIEKGYITEDLLYETLLSIKRAGADMIISYFVPQLLGIE
ncbi:MULTISPECIES: porphobilinogen synthase [Methanosphaera]|uniref:Delta-aminolevulinic acid dehydratase n=2 Tax=Methanosphaera stadtmanae TaxID=2317 RepID=Q2NH86_METST|nr:MULTISPECIES: porphobilinogen synthase [Methanosphaera]ABC56817.1 HemB [Methanosphaera stadtmanae DSM 3091]MDO5822204.1 porphobilinogen synthase [Methanosphaera sp.]MEE0488885.1 porphobilinogen synthase [Methanosphaera stadtmanae]OEC85384.1 delta-aminolevulinic acid dehydratase [Methanosphaera sp. A6]RAP03500.1 delta-aminolevulinic acid dehydratase [Methanosphaera stadtmanae]